MTSVVNQGSQEVVGCGNGMEVAGEMQVDGFHRNNLRVSAAGSTTLHTEGRSERRLSQSQTCFFAEFLKGLSNGDGSCCLSGAGRHTGSRRDENKFALGVRGVQSNFGFVSAVRNELVVGKTVFMGELIDRNELGLLCNFNVSQHVCP